ncbi:hypothetical protein EBS43_10000 [bacterium]|nr:hypothetical protein [bacterium]
MKKLSSQIKLRKQHSPPFLMPVRRAKRGLRLKQNLFILTQGLAFTFQSSMSWPLTQTTKPLRFTTHG